MWRNTQCINGGVGGAPFPSPNLFHQNNLNFFPKQKRYQRYACSTAHLVLGVTSGVGLSELKLTWNAKQAGCDILCQTKSTEHMGRHLEAAELVSQEVSGHLDYSPKIPSKLQQIYYKPHLHLNGWNIKRSKKCKKKKKKKKSVHRSPICCFACASNSLHLIYLPKTHSGMGGK